MSTVENDVTTTRDRIQNWLMAEGWSLSEQVHPSMAWLIRAEDAGGRRILVGQNQDQVDRIHIEARVDIADEHRRQFESLSEERRNGALWRLRFRLLRMNVDFTGVSEPIESVLLNQRIYLDALTRDSFVQRFLSVRNAVIAAIWTVMQDFDKGPAASGESTLPQMH